MIIIKIFDKDYNPRTTLTEQDFTDLEYMRKLGEIGDCRFNVRLDRNKVNETNLQHYNRIEIIDGGVKKFFGVITNKNIGLELAGIRCRESIYVFKKRLLGANYVVNDTVANAVTDLVADVNGVDDTNIAVESVVGAIGNVNMTFNYGNAFEILRQICESTGNQFTLSENGGIIVKAQVGTDRSADVSFRYNINQISNANILKFDVEDDGDDIISKAYGKSNAYSSTQTNSTLVTKYGVLEKYRDFRVVNSQTLLDSFTGYENKDKIYSPNIALNPKVNDDFVVGDLVKIRIKNSLVNINDSFQVLEKRVQYIGSQKRITVRINDLPNNLAEKLAERDVRLDLLEKEV